MATGIKKAEDRVKELESTVEGFSLALRDAANKNPDKMHEICQVLLDERKIAQDELDKAQGDLLTWRNKKEFVLHQFENLEAVMHSFDKKLDIEKKRIIQTIISAIVVDPNDLDHIELRINPDPKSGLIQEKKVQTKESWLAYAREARTVFTGPGAELFTILGKAACDPGTAAKLTV